MGVIRHRRRGFAIRGIVLAVVLICSVLLGAATARPGQLGIRVTQCKAYPHGHPSSDPSIMAMDCDQAEESEPEADDSNSSWMPETEAEHPACLPTAMKGISTPILLHGAAWHVYHIDFRSVTNAPSTPPPDAV